MKNSKRYLAILGVFLVGLYGATLVFAMFDSPAAYTMFKSLSVLYDSSSGIVVRHDFGVSSTETEK